MGKYGIYNATYTHSYVIRHNFNMKSIADAYARAIVHNQVIQSIFGFLIKQLPNMKIKYVKTKLWALQHHPTCFCCCFFLAYWDLDLIFGIWFNHFDKWYCMISMCVCYPKRSSSPYSNFLPDLINGANQFRILVLIIKKCLSIIIAIITDRKEFCNEF